MEAWYLKGVAEDRLRRRAEAVRSYKKFLDQATDFFASEKRVARERLAELATKTRRK